MTTSVIVVSHRPGDWLAPAIRSVLDQTAEVVLVDNGSEGASAWRIGRELGARVERSEVNLGFAAAVNLGARVASGDVLALLNDDAVAGPGWLAAAEAALAAPEVAAVTPKVLLSGWYRELNLGGDAFFAPGDERALGRRVSSVVVDGIDVLGAVRGPGVHRLEQRSSDPADPPRWRWSQPGRPAYVPIPDPSAPVTVDGETLAGPACRLLNKAGSWLRIDGVFDDVGDGTPDDGRWDRPGERFFASGTAMAVRAEVFARIGGLAEPYFAYSEDADWGWRARLAGLRILYDPTQEVEHRHGATSGGPATRWVQRLARRNQLLTLVRNAPLAAAPAVRRLLSEENPAGVRSAFALRLPWALATRRVLSRRWELSPAEVWAAWAGAVDGPHHAA